MGLTIEQQRQKIRDSITKVIEKPKVKLTPYQSTYNVAFKYRLELIKNKTKAEKFLINRLAEHGITFQFQKIFIGNGKFYICDFYFKEINLVIELDGKVHNNKKQKRKDSKRTKWLHKNHGVEVIRFKNGYVFDNPDVICELLDYRLTYGI